MNFQTCRVEIIWQIALKVPPVQTFGAMVLASLKARLKDYDCWDHCFEGHFHRNFMIKNPTPQAFSCTLSANKKKKQKKTYV